MKWGGSVVVAARTAIRRVYFLCFDHGSVSIVKFLGTLVAPDEAAQRNAGPKHL
jgi:hypothetical protein